MKNSKHNCDLKSCFLCNSCLPEWLPAIDVHRKTLQAKKGEIIFKEGHQVEGIYFIKEGKAKVHKQWGEDKELIVRIAGKGSILGHRGLGDSTIYPVTGTALEDTTLCYVNLDFFQSTLRVNHNFTYQLMMFFAEELQESERHMRDLAHMNVKSRVLKTLQMLQQKFGKTKEGFIDIVLSRQDLASLAGTTYETLFRTINELLEENLIKTDNKHFYIIDNSMTTES